MSTRKIHNYESIILVDETIKEFGYHPDKFGQSSAKFIVCACRFCGKPSKIRKGFFNKAGSACHKLCRIEEQKLQKSPFANPETRKKAEETNLKKYGSKHACQNKQVSQKISVSRQSQENIKKGAEVTETDIVVKKTKKSKPIKPKTIDIDVYKENVHSNKDIIDSIGTMCTEAVYNSDKIIPPLSLTAYIQSKKFAINFNNSHDSSELVMEPKVARHRQTVKTRACRDKGIRLLHVFEHQWNERSTQICNLIKSILGKNEIKVHGRKCQITNDECNSFIDNNHIQGYGRATIKFFNLVYENEVVASMTASAHHRQDNSSKNIVLNRLCFKDNTTVQGGASKLFKAFVTWAKTEGYDRIISWSDNSWTEGGIYTILGFELEKEYYPDYFYWDMKNNQYRSKQSQQKKHTNCPLDMTEREWCLERGLYRIYDAGKKLWTFSLDY